MYIHHITTHKSLAVVRVRTSRANYGTVSHAPRHADPTTQYYGWARSHKHTNTQCLAPTTEGGWGLYVRTATTWSSVVVLDNCLMPGSLLVSGGTRASELASQGRPYLGWCVTECVGRREEIPVQR